MLRAFCVSVIVYFLSSVIGSFAFANTEVIKFPEEELATETVLPKFDRPDVVKNRNVITAKKIEVGAYFGWNITEPIYNQGKLGLNLGYHLNEDSAIVANFAMWMSGLNTLYTDGLESTATSNPPLDFDRIPKKNYTLDVNYEWKMFYGKISLTKQSVINLSTYPILGGGVTVYEHKSYPGVNFGIGQKFYFSKSMALRADFKIILADQLSPFLKGRMTTAQPIPEPGEFKSQWGFGTVLDLGMSFLF